jgi:hypothetical protein
MKASIPISIVAVLTVGAPARAEESLGMRYVHMGWGWEAPTLGEVAFLAPAQILLALDVWQTLDIARHPKESRETNPWMGPHPSERRVLLVGLGTVAATTGIWVALPPKVRWIVPVALGSVEVAAVTHNFQMGAKLGF